MAPAGLRDSVGNLPAEVNSFVGRRQELSAAKALLGSGRLLTLTGMGGVGKTRLARRLLADVHRAFPDGVWQVELGELHEPGLVAASIASGLGFPEPQGGWSIESVQERLASRHLLLLLDNCEHLIDACALTVDALLRSCPDLHVVATSRQPLGIDGEQTLTVDPLATPDPERGPDLARLEDFDATRLFLARAGAVLPGFAVDRDNQRAVAALCHRVDGLPLALEFAALQVRALSLEEIVVRLDEESRLSVRGKRVAPPRQQSLRALVDWSFQLCSEPERVLWGLLSVFTGGFELDAIEFVCAGTAIADADVVDLVIGLVEKSVLVRETQNGGVRYRMAQVIREYGHGRLAESGQETSARRRHRDWCVSLTAQAYTAYAGPEQLRWFTRLRREHGDVHAALGFCLTDVNGAEPAAEILVSLLDYWVAFGFLSEARHWLDLLLHQASEPDLLRARLLRARGYVSVFLGDEAAWACDEARALTTLAGDETELAWIGYTEAIAAFVAGDVGRAEELLEEVLGPLRAAGDQHGVVNVLSARATLSAMSDQLDTAEARAEEFLAETASAGERWVRSYVLWGLGFGTWRSGDHRRAASLVLESARLRLPFEDRLGLSLSAEVLAWIAARDGDPQKAAVLLGAAQQAARAVWAPVPAPFMVTDHDSCERQLKAELGPAVLQEAVRRGSELTAEQVLDLASGTTSGRSAPAAEGGAEVPSPLTRREQEIAELVAQGISNKEIAARLVIAPRTAEGHVEHILVKLGFTSRSQIAAWVAERRRPPS